MLLKFRDDPPEAYTQAGVGRLFTRADNGEHYLLTGVGVNQVALVNLRSGLRYGGPVSVESIYHLSRAEFKEVIGTGQFTNIAPQSVPAGS